MFTYLHRKTVHIVPLLLCFTRLVNSSSGSMNSLNKRVTVVMPVDMHRRLKHIAFGEDCTMNKQILNAVEMYIRKYGCQNNV